jgi:hypothetical protein
VVRAKIHEATIVRIASTTLEDQATFRQDLVVQKAQIVHEPSRLGYIQKAIALILKGRLTELWRRWRRFKKAERCYAVLTGGLPPIVQRGPFKGMKYIPKATGSSLLPKISGYYECELHNQIERFLETPYRKVLNIGCAEGYYAVGLSMRLPYAKTLAYDTDPGAQHLCAELARLNGVASRLAIKGLLTSAELSIQISGERALIICDCEGAELGIFEPHVLQSLERCDLLIELHDFIVPNVSTTLFERFRETHHVSFVHTQARDVESLKKQVSLRGDLCKMILDEGRPHGMKWLVATAHVA